MFFAPSLGRAVGQGHFNDQTTGARVQFEFKVDGTSKGLTGQMQFLDQTNQFQVSSLGINSFGITGNQATFSGSATFSHGRTVNTVSFTIKAVGNKGLNGGNDFFWITLSNGYSASGYVSKGNIILSSK